MNSVDRFRNAAASIRNSHEACAMDLRIQFATIVSNALKTNRWTQARLAAVAGVQESRVSEVLHADENCTLDTLARFLHALNVKARLSTETVSDTFAFDEDENNGKERWLSLISEAFDSERLLFETPLGTSTGSGDLSPNVDRRFEAEFSSRRGSSSLSVFDHLSGGQYFGGAGENVRLSKELGVHFGRAAARARSVRTANERPARATGTRQRAKKAD